VWALATGADGALWTGTFHHGLARRDKDGHWQAYTTASTEGGLPFEIIPALALGADRALWIGTEQGLARLDKDKHWQTYTTSNTSGGLPNDIVNALTPGAEGALWIGTNGGLGYFRPASAPTHRIVEVIGASDQVNLVTQGTQTVSVVAFDRSYRTEPWLFRYAWRMMEPAYEPEPEITRSAVHRATFKHDGTYCFESTPSIATASGANLETSNSRLPSPRRIRWKRSSGRRQSICSLLDFSISRCSFL